MADHPGSTPRLLVATCATFALTAICFFLAYGNWVVSPLDPLFRITLDRFPWIRMSLIMTLFTSVAAAANANRHSSRSSLEAPTVYGVGVMPLLFLLLYPGGSQIGRPFGDSTLEYVFFPLMLVHGLGFQQIRQAFEEAWEAEPGQ